jgi:hypothetical protein
MGLSADPISSFVDMSYSAKSTGTSVSSKNGDSESARQFREKMAKARGEFQESLRRSRKALAEADAALKIGSR